MWDELCKSKMTSELTVGLQKWKIKSLQNSFIPIYTLIHHFMNPVHGTKISTEDKIIFYQ